jgi:hypothetical protein
MQRLTVAADHATAPPHAKPMPLSLPKVPRSGGWATAPCFSGHFAPAQSGHLGESLPPSTAELLENRDKYELHDHSKLKWPPLFPETLRGRSPVSD